MATFTSRTISGDSPKRKTCKKRWLSGGLIIVGLLVVLGTTMVPAIAAALASFTHLGNPLLLLSHNPDQMKENDGRTNILVLGLTKDHLRTDTVLLVSYYHQQQKIVALNIPRDLYSFDGYETTKLVSIFAHAKGRQPKDRTYPPSFLAQFLSKEYQLPIHYWVTVNFEGAQEIVDTLGGVDIAVEHSFTDYKYPTDDYSGYMVPAPSFQAGLQHMDGKTALIYTRSRHSLMNGEGSDFARSKRQEILLQAVLEKARAQGLLQNVLQLGKYLQIFGRNVYTNMTLGELTSALEIGKTMHFSSDFRTASWSLQSGFLCSSTDAAGQYILSYGIPSDCRGEAGLSTPSKYRDAAVQFVQQLLEETASGTTLLRTASGAHSLLNGTQKRPSPK